MKLNNYKLIFIAIGLVGVLLFSLPSFRILISIPDGSEKFSELYLLGSNKTAENFPSEIEINKNYSLYFGVRNHLGSPVYYVLYVKLGNDTDLLPTIANNLTSYLNPLYEFRFFVQNDMFIEKQMNFKVSNVSFQNDQCVLGGLTINNVEFTIAKPSNSTTNNTYCYRLLFELWSYDFSNRALTFTNSFVYLQLNLVQAK